VWFHRPNGFGPQWIDMVDSSRLLADRYSVFLKEVRKLL
jgi:hypothetical protein